MVELTTQYIDDHLHGVHTAESWARAVTEQVLNGAKKSINAGDESASVQCNFTVSAFEPAGCIRICATIDGVYICYHQDF